MICEITISRDSILKNALLTGYSFTINRGLYLPESVGIRPFLCPNNCGRRYKYKAGVYQHLKFECGKERQFQCNVCLKKFSFRNNWKSHCIMKHGSVM